MKGPKGFTLERPRPSVLGTGALLQIPTTDVPRWRTALNKILRRYNGSIRHTVPLSLARRCTLGCWERSIKRISYFGKVPYRASHVVGVGDRLYLLLDGYDWAGYPISREELEQILACIG
jgi:hypothetical protein